jgi:hypothetical protein
MSFRTRERRSSGVRTVGGCSRARRRRARSLLAGVVPFICALCAAPALAHPSSGIVVDEKGQIFFADNSGEHGRIWKIDAEGKLSPLQKKGWHWLALDVDGSFARSDFKKWFAERTAPNFDRVPLSDRGAALIQTDGAPVVIAADRLWFAKGNLEVAGLSPDGTVQLLAPGLKETTERLGGIKGLVPGPEGSLYVACPSAVLKIGADGRVKTLVHPIVLTDCDADLPPGTPESEKPYLRGLAVDAQGTVYAAAGGCRRVVKVTSDGKVEVVLKAEAPWSPTGVAVRGHDVFVLEYSHSDSADHAKWLPRVRKLGRDGKATTLATISQEDRERARREG